MKIKLSAKQKEAIIYMRNGCGLALSVQMVRMLTKRAWLQEGGIGKGGISHRTTPKTIDVLLKLNLIEKSPESNLGSTKYLLTELGKTIEL